jgi:hypothetical protein
VEDTANSLALRGKKWDGFVLAEGKKRREFTDTAKVIEILDKMGVKGVQKKLSLTNVEDALGREKFKKIFGGYVKVVGGKPKLEGENTGDVK